MERYPRPLRQKERDLLAYVLPVDRPGYRPYLDRLDRMAVIGEGRRGAGNLVLGMPGDVPDTSGALRRIVAYGVVETTEDEFTVTVREEAGDQIDVEIVSRAGREVPDHFEEKRRWTYSAWLPGDPSPATRAPVRTVRVDAEVTLVLAPADRRLWVYDGSGGMVLPVPVTNFHNALMRVKGIRDPAVALDAGGLFRQAAEVTDEDLRSAFLLYNMQRPKVTLAPAPVPPPRQGLRGVVRRWLRGST